MANIKTEQAASLILEKQKHIVILKVRGATTIYVKW